MHSFVKFSDIRENREYVLYVKNVANSEFGETNQIVMGRIEEKGPDYIIIENYRRVAQTGNGFRRFNRGQICAIQKI